MNNLRSFIKKINIKKMAIYNLISAFSMLEAAEQLSILPESHEDENIGSYRVTRAVYDIIHSTQSLMNEAMQDPKVLRTVFNQDTLLDNQVLVISAREQKSGIGQAGRSWQSPRGNIYVTYAFSFPDLKDSGSYLRKLASLIPLVSNVAVCETVEMYGLKPQFKWINDMLLDGKKAAGMLCANNGATPVYSPERSETLLKNVILVGIGLNVNLSKDEAVDKFEKTTDSFKQPFGSMKISSNDSDYDVDEVLKCLTFNLCRNYKLIEQGFSFGWFIPQINYRLAYKGLEVEYYDDGETIRVIFEGLNDDNGHAVLRLNDGTSKNVCVGRIRSLAID